MYHKDSKLLYFTQSILIILYYQLKFYLLIQESRFLRIALFEPLYEV